jgi:hypothetical protein
MLRVTAAAGQAIGVHHTAVGQGIYLERQSSGQWGEWLEVLECLKSKHWDASLDNPRGYPWTGQL